MKKLSLMMLTILSGLFIISTAYAANINCTADGTCENATFSTVAPDALILLDLSENMNLNPAGGTKKYGSSVSGSVECVADTTNCAGANCADGFCEYSTDNANCTTDCSRLAIAKRAIFDLLDDDNNDQIDTQDAISMGIRIGFMRFKDGELSASDIEPNLNYSAGNILLIKPIADATTYQNIYCGAAASGSCASSATTCVSGSECIANATATGGASVARAISEAKLYLDASKTADSTAGACRQKFVILLTTSSDNCYGVSCSSGTCPYGNQCVAECRDNDNSASRRRATVAAAKALRAAGVANGAGYTLYTIGFGEGMPIDLKNTLNWIARWGGTDNPMEVNVGDPASYDPANSPPGSTINNLDCGGSGSTAVNWYAATNDPGYSVAHPLSGYAFIAANGSDLSASLKEAISAIRDQTYSFTRVSVQTVRTIDENYIYEASFTPLLGATDKDPFWIGHLKRYALNQDGSLAASADWDAGGILQARTGSTRTIYTYKGGSLTVFNTANISNTDLDVSTDAVRERVVNFIYDGDTNYDSGTTEGAAKYGWKLGDIFHSSPISIGTPSTFFSDKVDQSSPKAYDTYRAANQRTTALANRLIVSGANDGQFHVFRTSDGTELWSFIPPNFLSRLKGFEHTTHSPLPSATHQYFVDGPTTASDVWTGTGAGTSKSSSDWKAYMIISEGRGGSVKLWSSSQYCDSGFSNTYSSTYNRYCGYYAFDVTNTTATTPTYLWHFGGTSALTATQGDHLGQPWSKITIGRVKISGNERWVGFAAGGFAATDCKTANNCSKCDKRGKGFYVIDILTGEILWSYTACGTAVAGSAVISSSMAMAYSLSGQPASVDIDDDGFIETVYAADLGGNVWRFKMCTSTDTSSCSTSNWTGGLFFETSSGNIRPIYTKPTVVHSTSGDVWVYFGSGDVNDPTASNAQEKMYAIKDNDRTSTWRIGDLNNITSGTYNGTSQGWYMNLSGSGQKILADPTVYADVVYFTSYNPGSSNNVCATGGQASLNAVDYITGAGMYTDSSGNATRSTAAGTGIASGAVVSENPYGGTNIYVTTSEGAKINPVQPPDPFANKPNLQYWQDMRVK